MNANKIEKLAAIDKTVAPSAVCDGMGASYEKPTVHELGNLDRLQAYGFNYFDGRRYKNDPCS